MSSFSIHFHPLQEASYNADGKRHTTAVEKNNQGKDSEYTQLSSDQLHWFSIEKQIKWSIRGISDLVTF